MQKIHLKLSPDQKIFFTSDLHFGHRNVISFCNRPFINEKDMGSKLIENWNSVVGENDIIFVLGDTFWFNDSRAIKKVLNSLNGEIYILPGNHDDFSSYHRVNNPKIHLCEDIAVLWLESEDNRWSKKIIEIWMSHYPMMTWPHREKGAYQCFGHIHSKIGGRNGDMDQDLPLHWNQVDVGCDFWDYKPVSLEHLLMYMQLKKGKKEPK